MFHTMPPTAFEELSTKEKLHFSFSIAQYLTVVRTRKQYKLIKGKVCRS